MNKNRTYAWYIVFINALVGCTITASFPQFSLTVGELAQVSGLSEQILLGSDTVKSIGIVSAMLVSGFFYKKLGARGTFILALLATAVPQFLFPYITSVPSMMAAKFIQGFSSVIFPVFLLIIMEWIDDSQTGSATAIFNGIFYGGGGIGGTIAGFAIASRGWISSYYVVGILQVLFGVIWLITVKEKPHNAPHASAAPVCASGADAANESGKGKTPPLGRMLGMPSVWLLCLALFSTTFALQAITVDMPLFGSALGYDQMSTGKIVTAVTIGIILSCLISGKISDFAAQRMKNKAKGRILVLLTGPALIVLSALLLTMLPLERFGVFYAATLIFSFAAAWGLGTFYAVLPEIFDQNTLPIITGLSGGIGDIGMPLAPFIVGVVFGVNGLWHWGWASCGLMALLSVAACLALLKMPLQAQRQTES